MKLGSNAMGDLSQHFSRAEFACHCCGDLKVDPKLVEAMEELRARAGAAIVVHDGYRCPAHNQNVGGVSDSEHTKGLAADISIAGLTVQQMYELALEIADFKDGGIGVYDAGFVHVDVRDYAARWARVRGQYVGIQHLIKEPVVNA